MFSSFFTLAMVSPGRQRTLRTVAVAHVLMLGAALATLSMSGPGRTPMPLGNALLVVGIVEGALLVGWRLTQLPKSQALEFLLVTPLRPPLVLLAEALVGLGRLALVTLAGLPVLLGAVGQGLLLPGDLPALLGLPFIWGAVTGLGLMAWAYEPAGVRRWGERVIVAGILFYLVVGVLAGEHLPRWVAVLPAPLGRLFMACFHGGHAYNPFGVMKYAMETEPAWAWPRVGALVGLGALLAGALLVRGCLRLHGHFQEEHYRPAVDTSGRARPAVGDRPLTWWAVKRVSRYAGRINLWLAGGFGVVYAVYTVAGPLWPAWLGRQVFVIFDSVGGVPVVAAALVLLASVPAAFQYGLWDSSAPDRCRRLELLLLTRLDGAAYWEAAAAAAWRRGRGYFAVALLLWGAACVAGRASPAQVLAAGAAGVLLWGLYFTVGFRAFARGMQASTLGMALTLLLPLAAYVAARTGHPVLAAWLPPGSIYFGSTAAPDLVWMVGPVAAGILTLALARRALTGCDADLRRWYDRHHGAKVAE